jgi:hypothetical protein
MSAPSGGIAIQLKVTFWSAGTSTLKYRVGSLA